MCLILIALNRHPRYPLVLAANRDEYFDRPTREADYWEDAPHVLGGRDLKAGGSWLGVDKRGRLAAVTNLREPPLTRTGLASRGGLVADFLKSTVQPEDYLDGVVQRRHRYDGYNLLVGNGTKLFFHNSRHAGYRQLDDGVHAVSNGDLDAGWPKIVRGGTALSALLESGSEPEPEALFTILGDTTVAADEELPDTGIGRDLERGLSPVFVRMNGYGTRCSTVVFLDAHRSLTFYERSFGEDGTASAPRRFEFTLESG